MFVLDLDKAVQNLKYIDTNHSPCVCLIPLVSFSVCAHPPPHGYGRSSGRGRVHFRRFCFTWEHMGQRNQRGEFRGEGGKPGSAIRLSPIQYKPHFSNFVFYSPSLCVPTPRPCPIRCPPRSLLSLLYGSDAGGGVATLPGIHSDSPRSEYFIRF